MSDDAAAALAVLLGRALRPESLVALQHALAVAQIDGVGGTLVITVPRKTSGDVEVRFTTGSVRITLEH